MVCPDLSKIAASTGIAKIQTNPFAVEFVFEIFPSIAMYLL
jgi:hypothetical protein